MELETEIDARTQRTAEDPAPLRTGSIPARGRMRFAGSAAVAPGTCVALEGVGQGFDGDFFVTGVEHRIEAGAWTTDVEFGPH